ncbi:MAG: cysteine--tRNA ligase [Pseudomonadota bacterium]
MSDAPISLYNTLTRAKEPFKPIDATNVRMYVCGPTVYDHAHIGNARPAIVFDVLFRLLRHTYGTDNVTYARNITDVDDKIINRARRDFPDLDLNQAIGKVTSGTEKQYRDDMLALGCLEPSVQPRATENIPQMLELIDSLIARGHAYEVRNATGLNEVLFSVTSMDGYGQLSNRKLEDQQAGARVAIEDHKRDPGDFILWKQAAEGEPGWDSAYGYGRPGWHLECSAMSKRYLGERFDIHGGGLDLIFPHHENEIAQSCCAAETSDGAEAMANVWMHNGFVQVEGKKMSKSDGNFITVHDLLHTEKFGGRTWPGPVLRLAMLMTHYREPLDFTLRRLEEAETLIQKMRRRVQEADDNSADALVSALSDDLSCSAVLRSLSDLSGPVLFQTASGLLGIDLSEERVHASSMVYDGFEASSRHGTVTLEDLIEERLEAFKAKDFATADRIRDELKTQRIQLKDGKDPDTGERVTTWEAI